MATRIRYLDFAVPNAGGLPVIDDPGEFANSVIALLGGRIDRWLWAGGQKILSSPLTMRDAARGDAVATLGLGSRVNTANAEFADMPYISMPGANLQSQFRLSGDAWPDEGYALLISMLAPSGTGIYTIGGRSGSNPFLRIDTNLGRFIWQQGAPGGSQNWIVSDAQIVPNAKLLILLSYDAVSQIRRLYINGVDHVAELAASPNVDSSGFYTYVGGNNSMTTDMPPAEMRFGDWLRVNGALHGTLTLDRDREDILGLFAAHYGWALG